ncbi:MAG: hypothetical protein V1782_10075, partial [Pseudomonadota bacterium]
ALRFVPVFLAAPRFFTADKKKNKILVKGREKVYTFSSLNETRPEEVRLSPYGDLSRCPLARFVKGVLSCQKNVRFVEKARPPATM